MQEPVLTTEMKKAFKEMEKLFTLDEKEFENTPPLDEEIEEESETK